MTKHPRWYSVILPYCQRRYGGRNHYGMGTLAANEEEEVAASTELEISGEHQLSLRELTEDQGRPVPCRAMIWWIRAVPNISVPCPYDPCRAKYFRAVPCLAVPGSWYQILVPRSWYQDLKFRNQRSLN